VVTAPMGRTLSCRDSLSTGYLAQRPLDGFTTVSEWGRIVLKRKTFHVSHGDLHDPKDGNSRWARLIASS
jgi:hypothetical protein